MSIFKGKEIKELNENIDFLMEHIKSLQDQVSADKDHISFLMEELIKLKALRGNQV